MELIENELYTITFITGTIINCKYLRTEDSNDCLFEYIEYSDEYPLSPNYNIFGSNTRKFYIPKYLIDKCDVKKLNI